MTLLLGWTFKTSLLLILALVVVRLLRSASAAEHQPPRAPAVASVTGARGTDETTLSRSCGRRCWAEYALPAPLSGAIALHS